MLCIREGVMSGGIASAGCGGKVLKLVVNGIKSLGDCLENRGY